MPQLADVIIVGGGVIGCSIAYHLGLAGVRSTVLERTGIASGASGVAAGMLTAATTRPGPLLDLNLASLKMFPDTLKALHEASGIDPEYITAGTLRVAFTEQEADELQATTPLLKKYMEADWVKADDVLQTEPSLSREVLGALYTPTERQVRSHRLTQAYAQAAAHAQRLASFRIGVTVTGLTYQGERVTGVRLSDGTHVSADHVVIAAGAWSGALTEGIGVHVPVRPVRGQILSIQTLPRAFRMCVFSGHSYLTPKVDGSILVGATQEEVGFDTRATADGVARLLSLIPRLAPDLSSAPLGPIQVGLRPGTPDGAPILGPVPGWEGVSLATGHFRGGILLSAITGVLMSESIIQGTTKIPLEPFSLARFE